MKANSSVSLQWQRGLHISFHSGRICGRNLTKTISVCLWSVPIATLSKGSLHYSLKLIRTNKDHNVIQSCEALICALVNWLTVIWLKSRLVSYSKFFLKAVNKKRKKKASVLGKITRTRLRLCCKWRLSKNKACRKREWRITECVHVCVFNSRTKVRIPLSPVSQSTPTPTKPQFDRCLLKWRGICASKMGRLGRSARGTFFSSGWVLYLRKDRQRDSLQSVSKRFFSASLVLDWNVMKKKLISGCEKYNNSLISPLKNAHIPHYLYWVSPAEYKCKFFYFLNIKMSVWSRLIKLLFGQEKK